MQYAFLAILAFFTACACQHPGQPHLRVQVVNPNEVRNVNTSATESPKFQPGSLHGGNGVFVRATSDAKKERLYFYNGGETAEEVEIDGSPSPLYVDATFASVDSTRMDVGQLGVLNVRRVWFLSSEDYQFFVVDGKLYVVDGKVIHNIEMPMALLDATDFTAIDPTPYFGDLTPPDSVEAEGLIAFAARYGNPPKERPWIIKLKELRECLAH